MVHYLSADSCTSVLAVLSEKALGTGSISRCGHETP